jgi:hypothetical protein
VFSYKIGESIAGSMFGPCLIKQFAIPKESVALWMSTAGKAGSLLGSLAGGLLATRMRLVRAVGVAAALRSLPMFAQWAVAVSLLPADKTTIAWVAASEHFFGGVLTTCMFALMMSRVDRRIGATHFTVLAAVEVLGKTPSGLLSGFLVSWFGFGPTFLAAAAVSIAFVALLAPLSRQSASAAAPAG